MLAALLAYALMFQAIGGSVAGAGMAAASIEGRHAGHVSHQVGEPQSVLPECCTTLCAIACAAGMGASPDSGADLGPALLAVLAAPKPAAAKLPARRHRASRPDARAPPPLSA